MLLSGNKSKTKSIALERVERLINLANSIFDKRPDLAHRYIELVWKIKTRYNLRLSRDLERRFCRKCKSLWVPGETCRVRLRSSRSSRVVITCLQCGYKKRYPY